MILIENTEVSGWEAAIRGMRNPLNSWDKMDSRLSDFTLESDVMCNFMFLKSEFEVGPNDLSLMKKLVAAGSDHRKFMRFITVTADVTAPLYWWKEYDTYKVGTVANSCSTMHTIHKKEFTLDDFSDENLFYRSLDCLQETIRILNIYRRLYLEGGMEDLLTGRARVFEKHDKDVWWQMIQLLPSSYNQKRTVLLNYEVLRNMYHARKNHKLDEWRKGFCRWVEGLPYSELITGGVNDG